MNQLSFIWIYIIPMLFISPFLTISMNSWFSIWMTIELNLMSFIPLIIYMNKYYKEMSMKYFIIQAFSSSMLLFSSNFLFMNINNYNNNLFLIINIMMNISMMIKIGSVPFHSWFINMMNNLTWMSCLILSTWQKLIPMIILSYIYNNEIIMISSILSSITGAMYGLNYVSLRLILSYSSINQLSWMLINLMINESLWILYFMSYSIITMSIMLICNKFNIFYINQINNLKNYSYFKYMLLTNFFSLSSLPPMMGFMMKWYSMLIITNNKFYLLLTILIMMSLLTFIFYTRICFSILVHKKINNKMMYMFKFFNLNKMSYLNIFIVLSFMNLWILNTWMC